MHWWMGELQSYCNGAICLHASRASASAPARGPSTHRTWYSLVCTRACRRAYHRAHARLRLLSPRANLSHARRGGARKQSAPEE